MNDRLSLPTIIVICLLGVVAIPILKVAEWQYSRDAKKKTIKLRFENL